MKIISWNVSNQATRWGRFPKKQRFKNYEKHVDFLKESNADVICLQELTDESIAHLEESMQNYELFALEANESRAPAPKKLGILVKRIHKVKTSNEIPIEQHSLSTPFLGKPDKKPVSQHVDIETKDGENLRIFNLHLTWQAPPQQRAYELDKTLEHLSPDAANVLAGDFNSFGNIIPFFGERPNYFNDYNASDLGNISTLSKSTGLSSLFPLDGKTKTMPIAYLNSQLDHVLYDDKIEIKPQTKQVNHNLNGSDHYAISTEFAVKKPEAVKSRWVQKSTQEKTVQIEKEAGLELA